MNAHPSPAMIEALRIAARGPVSTSGRPVADRATVNPGTARSLEGRGWLARNLDADGAIVFRVTVEGLRALHLAAARCELGCAFCAGISARGYTPGPCDSGPDDGRPLPSPPKRRQAAAPAAREAHVPGAVRHSRPYVAASARGSAVKPPFASGTARGPSKWSTR